MKISVVGTGYVGLVTGTCFAEAGNDVTCIDINQAKITQLKRGDIPIYEPGLEDLFRRTMKEKRLHFTTDLREGITGSAVIFLALPTPPKPDGSADLSSILGVAKGLGPLLKRYTVIVNKSTVPVGTADQVREQVAVGATVDFDVVSNPEFLREGRAVEDFQYPDRLVIGTSSDQAWQVMRRLYKPFVSADVQRLIRMDERSAEMTKYAANALLATRISFINSIANLCEAAEADIDKVRQGIGMDARIGPSFLFPGPGYGGSCFPKDVQALAHMGRKLGMELPVLEAVHTINEQQKHRLTEKIKVYYKDAIDGKTFALWGLAFKPKTDDVREAPALNVIQSLTAAGAKVVAYDPEAMDNVRKLLGGTVGLSFARDEYEGLAGADALVIVTDWDEFKTPDFKRIKDLLKAPVIFDGRNLYELEQMAEQAFYYESIGRSIVSGQTDYSY